MKKYWYRLKGRFQYWAMCLRNPKRYRCPRCRALLRFDDVHHTGDDYSKPFCTPDPNFKWGGLVVDGKPLDAAP